MAGDNEEAVGKNLLRPRKTAHLLMENETTSGRIRRQSAQWDLLNRLFGRKMKGVGNRLRKQAVRNHVQSMEKIRRLIHVESKKLDTMELYYVMSWSLFLDVKCVVDHQVALLVIIHKLDR